MFQSIDTHDKSLTERVCEQIVRLIQESELCAGDKLPNEFDLAHRLNVGRGTVRESVKLLVSRNILEIRRGKGTYVSEHTGVYEDPLGLAFFQDKYKLACDLQEIRFMLEPDIAAVAACSATVADIAEMRRLCAIIEEMAPRGENYQDFDVQLHTCIAKSTKNLVIPNIIPIIHQGIFIFIDLSQRSYWQETIRNHREVVNAIERHDADAAARFMTCHLMDNREGLNRIAQSMQNNAPLRVNPSE